MKKIFLVFLSSVFFACDDGSSSTNVIEQISEEERCADIYGYELDGVNWSGYYDETSFLKNDIKNRARDVVSSYSMNMETRTIEYNESGDNYKILVMDLSNSLSAHNRFVYANIEGCSYRFSEDSDLSSYLEKKPEYQINSCVCKEKDGKFYYLDARKNAGRTQLSSSAKSEVSSSSKVSLSSSSSEKKVIEPVVAKSFPLECGDAKTEKDDLMDYTVAYEFDDMADMGKDFFGRNPAFVEDGMPSVDGDCNSLILDGTNGLRVSISDDFKNKSFVVEIRFMPETTAVMGNIFSAEPPGSGKDGWMIRLDEQSLDFHIRDADNGNWMVEKFGDVSLKEWHLVKAEIFPSKSEVGESVFYSLNLSLDGNLVLTSEFKGDVSQLNFDLGIGYDAVHQQYHEQRFFKGKIDYIRYGAISEDGD